MYFVKDFQETLGPDVPTYFYGMIEQRVASRARTFVGTYYSTFTGYINRMRGYHSQAAKAPGYKQGAVKSYYFAPLEAKYAMTEFESVFVPMWGREFPVAWRDIDHDVDVGARRHCWNANTG